MTRIAHRSTPVEPDFEFVAGAGIPDAAGWYAREKVSRLYRLVPGRVVHARVTMARVPGRSTGRSCSAQAVVDLGGTQVRAHVEASEAFEAVDLLQQRLRERIVRTSERQRERRVPARPTTGPAADDHPAPPADDHPAPPAGDDVVAAAHDRLQTELSRLLATRATLVAEGLDVMTECEDVAELSGADQHPADLGTETFERTRDLSLLHEVEAEIAAVRSAVQRIDAGTYGRCDVCGEVIPTARLLAVPATRLCLDDQERAERAAEGSRTVGTVRSNP